MTRPPVTKKETVDEVGELVGLVDGEAVVRMVGAAVSPGATGGGVVDETGAGVFETGLEGDPLPGVGGAADGATGDGVPG